MLENSKSNDRDHRTQTTPATNNHTPKFRCIALVSLRQDGLAVDAKRDNTCPIKIFQLSKNIVADADTIAELI
jgi:hypothetical protein